MAMLPLLLISSFSLLLGVGVLLAFDANTLFLAALLLAVVSVKLEKRVDLFDKFIGVWFALSVAPASSLTLALLAAFENGLLLQALLSWLLFLVFYAKKPSIIEKLYKSKHESVGIIASASVAGFAAGIVSAALWQIYPQLIA